VAVDASRLRVSTRKTAALAALAPQECAHAGRTNENGTAYAIPFLLAPSTPAFN